MLALGATRAVVRSVYHQIWHMPAPFSWTQELSSGWTLVTGCPRSVAALASVQLWSLASPRACHTCPHNSPDREIQWIEIWWVRRPFVLVDKFRTMVLQPVLRLLWSVSRCTILLKQEVVMHELMAIINQSRQQLLSVIIAVHLHLLRNEVQSTLPHEADSCWHHHAAWELWSLSDQTTRSDVLLLSYLPKPTAGTICHRRIEIKHFLVSEKHSFHFLNCYEKDTAVIRLNILMLTFKIVDFCLKRHVFVRGGTF